MNALRENWEYQDVRFGWLRDHININPSRHSSVDEGGILSPLQGIGIRFEGFRTKSISNEQERRRTGKLYVHFQGKINRKWDYEV